MSSSQVPTQNPLPSHIVSILNIPISRLDFETCLDLCHERGLSKKGGYVCFVNVHTAIEATQHPRIQTIFEQAFLAVADGTPLVWTSKLKGQPVASRIAGPDFMAAFLREFPDESFGLIGGAPGVADQIADHFALNAVSYSPPHRPFLPERAQADWQDFLKLCPEQTPPPFVFVGLGAPKQELWMQEVSRLAPETLFFGVGAAFDFLAGTRNRAPQWLQKMGLEWTHRLSQEPVRLGKRYLKTNLSFIVRVGFELLGVK